MEISKEELDTISRRLCDLATELHFMYDEAIIVSRLVGCYCNTLYRVIPQLKYVLHRSDALLDDLHRVEASLDDLLIKEKILDDEECSKGNVE